jgi:hypothetical protein
VNIGTRDNVLGRVSCVSKMSCKTVGSHVNSGGVSQTLIESYG